MSLLCKVGSFAKSTGGAPATQAISGLGFQPKALILWTSGGIVDGTIRTQAGGDDRHCFAIVSGTAAADQFAIANTAVAAGSGGRRRYTQKSFLLATAAGAVSSEATLTSFDVDGFTLSWTTNAVGESQVIHYLALAGADLLAKVVFLTTPAGTGNFATTGVGFQPNLLISAGPISGGILDNAAALLAPRLGAAVSASSRWSEAAATNQNLSDAAWRLHRNNSFLAAVNDTGTLNAELDFVSFQSDGFTLNQVSGASNKLAVLCINAPRVGLGTFTKPTGGGPVSGSVSLGFIPSVVLLASDQDINRANAASQTGARMGISAFTAANAESSVWSVPNAANPIAFAALDKSAKAAVKIDNATPAIDAEATGSMVLANGGFSLTWNANDAVATEYGYVAIGDVAPLTPLKGAGRVTQRRHTANRSRMPRGAWRRRSA